MQLRSAAIALLLCTSALPGCDKVSQCNKLIDTLNKETTKMGEAMGKLGDVQSKPEVVGEYETAVQVAIDEVKALEFSDEKIGAFSKRYIELLGTIKGMGAEMKDAAADPTKIEAVQKKMEDVEKTESSLVDEVNTYCSGS